MKKLLLGVMILAFFIGACASGEQKQWDRRWEGPIVSPSPMTVPDRQ